MPKKNITLIGLPEEQPDCCVLCPLLGVIPADKRKHGSKETHICLGTHDAISQRGTRIRASQRDQKHPLHRPCDALWAAWMKLPKRRIGINTDNYLTCRIPFEQSQQLIIKYHG